jgi:Tfp pilus assembly protein PilN
LEENGQVFNSFNVSGGEINVSGRGRNFRQLADTLIWLRENELFEYADISSVSASLEDSNQLPPIDVLLAMYGDNMEVLQQLLENSLDTYTNFSMNIQLQRGGGER